jgi:hypothetical protein
VLCKHEVTGSIPVSSTSSLRLHKVEPSIERLRVEFWADVLLVPLRRALMKVGEDDV